MSIARHHNEWLSLLEVSGPFLSLPVLMRIFPQGLEEQDSEARKSLRIAHDEWEADGSFEGDRRPGRRLCRNRCRIEAKGVASEGVRNVRRFHEDCC